LRAELTRRSAGSYRVRGANRPDRLVQDDGTGGQVTIDTAGTAFDTVVGVCDGTTSNPIACVDDVQLGVSRDARMLQAAVTIPTQAGHIYLIQAGGFDSGGQPIGGDVGTLVLTRR
jgi:hypothetical protein